MSDDAEEFRPRFGHVLRSNGRTQPVYYHPDPEEADAFVALDPADDSEIELYPGDTLHFDRLAPHQSIYVVKTDGEKQRGRTKNGWRGAKMEEQKQKDPNGWWKGLVVLAGICAIVVLTIAGVNWALSL